MPRQSTRQRKVPDRFKPYDWRPEITRSYQPIYHYEYRPTMSLDELQNLENWRDYYLRWTIDNLFKNAN